MADTLLNERHYLETHVMSYLMKALEEAAMLKPNNPIEFIAEHVLK